MPIAVKRPRVLARSRLTGAWGVEDPPLVEDFSAEVTGFSAGDVAAGLPSAIGKAHACSR